MDECRRGNHYGPSNDSSTQSRKHNSNRQRSRSRSQNRKKRTKSSGVGQLIGGKDGGAKYEWGKTEDAEEEEDVGPVEKPNFGLSGALAKDSETGNVLNGIVLKWSEPIDAAIAQTKWRLYVFKKEENIGTIHLHSQSAFLIGREKKIADILVEHGSCSKQHAVIQFRRISTDTVETENGHRIVPYIMDLKSTNCTLLNGKKIDHSRYIELREKDVLRFGESTREYVLMKVT